MCSTVDYNYKNKRYIRQQVGLYIFSQLTFELRVQFDPRSLTGKMSTRGRTNNYLNCLRNTAIELVYYQCSA